MQFSMTSKCQAACKTSNTTLIEKALALFGTCRCKPIFDDGPQNAIGIAMGGAGGDALRARHLIN